MTPPAPRIAPRPLRPARLARSAMAGLVLCAGLVAGAPAPAAGGHGWEARALAHYERMTRAERVAIEYDLIWIGAVDMVTNGVVGRDSIAAIREFERHARLGAADGILGTRERNRLARRAERARERAGYRVALDAATGMRIGIPFAYTGRPVPSRHGALYEGPGVRIETFVLRQGLRETYLATLRKPGRRVTYEALRGDWFVVAGREGGRAFYTRAHRGKRDLRAFTVTYDLRHEARMEPVVTAMSNDLKAFAARPERGRRPHVEGHPAPHGAYGHDGRGAHKLPREAPAGPPGHAGPPEYTGPGSIERDYDGPAPGSAFVDGESCARRITVSPGDTLGRIGARCGVSVAALRAANGGIEPRALQAGQSLAIPRGHVAGQEIYEAPEAYDAPEAFRPAVAVRPRAPQVGGTVSVALTGFPAGASVEVGFAGAVGAALTETVLATGSGGAATARLRLPGRFGAGESIRVVASTDDGALRAEAGPFVVRPAEGAPGAGAAPLSLSGMITGEGMACLSMRDASGGLWMLDSARAVAPGTSVAVEGYEAGPEARARCGSRTIEVARLETR